MKYEAKQFFADNIFPFIFLNEICFILVQISLEFVPNWQLVSIGSYNGFMPISMS